MANEHNRAEAIQCHLVGCTAKYRKIHKLKIHKINKLSTTQKKQKYHGSVAFYENWLGNKVGLFYNAPKPA